MRELPVPFVVRRVDQGAAIEIQWERQGHVAVYPARDLRLACRCAACVEGMSGRPTLGPALVPPGGRALALARVGAYAVQVTWSDGHSTGIYPWERLFANCPCDACVARRGSADRETTTWNG